MIVLGGGAFAEVIRSWGWSPHDRISALIKETPQSSHFPSAVAGPREKTVVHGPDTKPTGALILVLPAFRTMTNKCYLSHLGVCGIFVTVPGMNQDTYYKPGVLDKHDLIYCSQQPCEVGATIIFELREVK